jgi:2-octaprenylphenol hydroxylase
MKSQFSIVIVGAGITGLTLAALLAKGRHASALDITVIDAAKRPRFSTGDDVSLRVSAIANGSAELLDSVGAWSIIKQARVSPYESMRVWDESDAPDGGATLRFDAAEFAVPQLGHIVENVLIQDALLKVLDKCDVSLQFETKIESLPDADLVVGADGARSFVRELAGIKTNQWPYEQTAVVTHLSTEIDHDATARQRFLRDGPLGMLPLTDGRISVVWSTTPDVAKQAMEASDDELGAMLTDASDGVLGKLTVAGPKGAFPLCAQHAEDYVKEGIALVGDAAHAIHPLAGQGANLGLQDTATLARVIDDAIDAGLHPGDRPVLRRYERARKGDNLTMMHFMTGLNRLFTTDSKVLGEIRLAGMRLFNRSGPVRERAVKVALGVK